MTMTEPKQTEGQRIADWYFSEDEAPRYHAELAKYIDDAISAERLKAQGLVKALMLAYDVMRGATMNKKGLERALKSAQVALQPYAAKEGNGG